MYIYNSAYKTHPGRGILQDISLQLLHENQVIEDYDGVILPLSDENSLKCLDGKRADLSVGSNLL